VEADLQKENTMKTILITGCSSGFGLETARVFLDRGWNVIATMRTPNPDVLTPSEHLRVLALDVTDLASIQAAVDGAGPIDVLVNNAGLGLLSVVEGTPLDTIRANFETNTFGTIAVTQAFLPQLRTRESAVIVNVSSSTTLIPLPMLAVYTASKAAINALTESLALELSPFGIRVHLVLPGRSPETPFGQNARAQMQRDGITVPEAYAAFAQSVFGAMGATTEAPVTHASDVAEAIWHAVNDPSSPLRIPAGADAIELASSAT
jgi:NAD(P)-dependent dehydrogenase (short-subunit alcohol dehydrogenase family)